MFPLYDNHEIPHKIFMPKWKTQDFHTLRTRRRAMVTDPNARAHCLRSNWFHTNTIPHARYATINTDSCFFPRSSALISCITFARSGPHTTYISSRKPNTSSSSCNCALIWTNASCQPKANNDGINGSPCSPPSLCKIFRFTPSASSHIYSLGSP